MPLRVQLEKAGGGRTFIDYGLTTRHRHGIVNTLEMVNTTKPGLLRDSLRAQLGAETKGLDQALGTASLLGIRLAVDPSPQQKRLMLRGIADDTEDYRGLTWFHDSQLAVARTIVDDLDGVLTASVELGLRDSGEVRVPLADCTLVSLIDTVLISPNLLPAHHGAR